MCQIGTKLSSLVGFGTDLDRSVHDSWARTCCFNGQSLSPRTIRIRFQLQPRHTTFESAGFIMGVDFHLKLGNFWGNQSSLAPTYVAALRLKEHGTADGTSAFARVLLHSQLLCRAKKFGINV
ncbi:Hypothetical_protein [Hexamita inflata]|uniref:Hypothetical_protein n=1 Tax=Hexamita inflata TaxID=28002 RepID=A0AA86USI5_9EUKA|nr:Hypothetical protein HINF_LOCUS35943 [Hexamita inflata]